MGGQGQDRTSEPTLLNSLSAETPTVCTRNLSRHFASGAGSSFIAWSRTESYSQSCPELEIVMVLPWTSTLPPASMRPEFGRTQYLKSGG